MQKQFEYKGQVVNYGDEGAGLVLVLLHGFAEDSTIWATQVDFLKKNYRVITPDMPGSGQSAYNAALESIEDYAAAIEALLKQANVGQCIMLGHSMGGYIMLAFAALYPQYLKGIGFVNSTAFADGEEKKLNRDKGIAVMQEYGAQAFIKNTTPNLFAAGYKKQFAAKVEALTTKGAGFTTAALQQYYRAMKNRPDRTPVLKQSGLPVLFIAGTEDVAVPLADTLKQVHQPLVSYIHIFEDTGHMAMMEAADKTNEAIAAFLRDVLA